MDKMFITEKEAAQKLGIPTGQMHKLGIDGVFQQFYDKNIVMYKNEQIELYKDSADHQNLPEWTGFIDFDTTPRKQTKKSDQYQTISIALFSVCLVLFLVSVFARRAYLLEFVVPAVSLVGVGFFGIGIMKHSKEKEIERKNAESTEQTEKLLSQAERLQRIQESNKSK